jgi:hypothetical protein
MQANDTNIKRYGDFWAKRNYAHHTLKPPYQDLCRWIYTTQGEHDRFRQLVVNTVMATDIVDEDLGAFRKHLWEIAF